MDAIEVALVVRRFMIDVIGLVMFIMGCRLLAKSITTTEPSKLEASFADKVKLSVSSAAVGAIVCALATVIFCVSLCNPPRVHTIEERRPQQAGGQDVVEKNAR